MGHERFRRGLIATVLTLSGLKAAPPARGVAQFESSAFCKKYRCVLSGPIEPLPIGGVVHEYFYNYRVYLPGGVRHPGQFGMRLTDEGERADPYLIIRWVPVHEFGAQDVVAINELVSEITGSRRFDAAGFVLQFVRERTAKPALGYGQPVRVGAYDIRCSYTPLKLSLIHI